MQNDYFTLEKSVDGTAFMPFGNIPGANTSNQNTYYTAFDLQPSYGVNYYRIRQTDTDGHNTLSETKQVLLSENKVIHFMISPNPTSGNLSITPIREPVSYQGKIVNILGEVVTEIPDTYGSVSLSLNHLIPGVYYVMISGNGFTRRQTIWLK
ncbi:MAG: T9SS type A sorting domain-containing protein [Bacteroidia bacterium]|nr:T9SS type A sorting domain-containing protein [Bacteroidia bacterium]